VNAPKLALVEYNAGNLASVERAFARLGAQTYRAARPGDIAAADALVLPGVGHFGALLNALREANLDGSLQEAIAAGKPFLGICVGLQMLFASSDEAADVPGLGIFSENVSELERSVKVPHMGWNQLRRVRGSRLLAGIADDAYFYFAHSYAALGADNATVAFCDHGAPLVAAVERDNIFGVQFHPEKSGESGAAVLSNFLSIASGRPAAEAA
jgi:imidazole glycerol-phosphate synthase subunit HisH